MYMGNIWIYSFVSVMILIWHYDPLLNIRNTCKRTMQSSKADVQMTSKLSMNTRKDKYS